MSTQYSPNDARTINASEFEARCLALIDEVAETGAPITITKDGQPVSRLVPCTPAERKGPPFPSPIGADRDILIIYDDDALVEPLANDWEEEWDKQWEEWL